MSSRDNNRNRRKEQERVKPISPLIALTSQGYGSQKRGRGENVKALLAKGIIQLNCHAYILHKLIVIRGGGTSGSRSTAAGGAKAKSPLRG